MGDQVIRLGGKRRSTFMDQVKELLPEGGNLNLCLTCGACSSGCPATGLDGMDPRKFLRMAALGMDDQIKASNWPWMCSMCQRCIYVCPMQIDIPQLVYNARKLRPREERPKGILGSCDMALRNGSTSAMGTSPEDFQFVVEDVLEEYQEAQPEFADMQAPIDKAGAEFFSTRIPGSRLPNRMSWYRCGKYFILQEWTGLMGARGGRRELLHVPCRR
jgi:ferredoxin